MRKVVLKQLERVSGLLALIGLVFAAQFWLWPQVAGSAAMLQMLRTSGQQSDILQERLAGVREDSQRWDSVAPQLGIIFPETGNTTQTVERLESVASDTGVRLNVQAIEQLSPVRPRRGSNGLVPLVVSVRVVAPAQRLLEFVDRVEHVPEVSHIWQFSLDPVQSVEGEDLPSGSETLLHELTMRVAFYLQEHQ